MLLVNNKEQLRNKEKQLDINNPKKDAICTLKISQIIGMKKFLPIFSSNMEILRRSDSDRVLETHMHLFVSKNPMMQQMRRPIFITKHLKVKL